MSIPLVLTCLCLGWAEPPAGTGSAPPSAFDLVASIETVVADAIERAEPSVVAIARNKGENNPNQETLAVRGRPRVTSRSGQNDLSIDSSRDYVTFDYGSGVVIGDQGQILTAFHVVRGASQLVVRAADRQQFEAEIIAADPRSDLAVIVPRLSETAEPPKLKPIAIGDVGKLRKGSFLVALGNPFNSARDGRPSASWGILSNVARRIELVSDNSFNPPIPKLQNYPTLLQLDSKLNLGMSGGAVVNMRGELVGVTTTGESPAGYDAQAGYAIPIDRIVRRAIDILKLGKEIEYGLLGIHAPRDGSSKVSEIVPNSPAAEGQVIADDQIVAVNNTPISNFDGLILAVHELSPGDSVRLKIIRDGKPIERTVVLGKFPIDGEVIATNRPAAWRGLRVDYMSPRNYRVPEIGPFAVVPKGVLVTSVEEGSLASAAGIKKGQLILRVDDQPVATPKKFEAAVAKLSGPVSLITDQGPVTVNSGR